MRPLVYVELPVAAPAREVWTYLTDWPRQGEWIPLTRVETVDPTRGPGGRLRAWTGVGPVGFWDTMTITAWSEDEDGSGRCEVLHTGRVVRGEGEFMVTATAAGCTVVWWERLDLPFGPLGVLAWRLLGWGFRRGVRDALRRMAAIAEAGRG